MFRGTHTAKVEESGRLKLPTDFKDLLDAAGITQFYITSTNGKSAEIWPLGEWEKREARLAELGDMDEAADRYLKMTSYYGQQTKIDSQGRMVLPQILRAAAKLNGEVGVMGKITYLEVYNLAQFEADLPANAVTAEDRKAIKAMLSGRGAARDV